MTTKDAKDFLVQQVTEQATLERVPLTELEKRMLYFVENDPDSCQNPLELNDEFEAQYDTPEYEAKIAGLLSNAYKRLKNEDPEKVRSWDAAMSLLSHGDHYFPVMWRLKIRNADGKPDSGRKVVACGSAAIVVVLVIATLVNVSGLPSWVLPSLGILVFSLCLLAMFFLAQQGYRALRRKFGKWPN